MTRHILLAVTLGLAPGVSAGEAPSIACEPVIAKDGPAAREVYLAGGEAWQLFQRYQEALKKKEGVDLDLAKAQVHLKTKGAAKDFARGGFWEMFGGIPKDLWEDELANLQADLDAEGLAHARQQGWDIYCPVPLPEPPPPVASAPSATATPQIAGAPAPATASAIGFKAGMIYAAQRDYRNAIKEFAAVEAADPAYPKLQMNMGVAYLQLRDYVQAIQHLTKALDQDKAAGRVDPDTHYNMACVQARLGQKDDAIRSLESALASGFQHGDRIAGDADLASLKGHPRFQDIVKKATPAR